MNESFSIEPSTNMMDVLGHSGYTFEYAIADLIDNCIAAKAKNVTIHIDANNDKPFLYILDDGVGMSKDELINAAILGHKDIGDARNGSDLGRYSTGLKAASRSLATNLIVSSFKNNEINTIQIDYNHIKNTGKWEAFFKSDFKFSKLIKKGGTIVYLDGLTIVDKKLSNSYLYNKIDSLIIELGHIYDKYIESEELNIYITTPTSTGNTIKVKPWNPFALPHDKSTRAIYADTFSYKGEDISAKIYIMPVFNNLDSIDQEYIEGKGLSDQQGFYIYRNNRLIQEGGWLDLKDFARDDKCNYARIEIDIPSTLDEEFSVNFSKNKIIVPDDLIEKFSGIASLARKQSRKNYNYVKEPRARKKRNNKNVTVWNVITNSSGTYLDINLDHPTVRDILKNVPEKEIKKLTTLLSKSIPVDIITGQGITVRKYTKEEIRELIFSTYYKLYNDGLDINAIKDKMYNTDPFKDYAEDLIEFFDRMGE